VTLTGTGTDLELSPARLGFSSHKVGTTSQAKTITVTNVANVAVNLTGLPSIGGADAADFLIAANTCGSTSIAAGATCTVSIKFSPTATGARDATLSVAVDGGGSPAPAPLSGMGT
jgi:hypothetical protein